MNIQNLQKLYEVGQRILRERLPLRFDRWDCGTFACLGGWYARTYRGNVNMADVYQVKRHFGLPLNTGAWSELFSSICRESDPYAELERRMEYLAGLIREAGGTVPNDKPHSTKTGIPESVRAIFAEPWDQVA